jgi:hypothetical protein
MGDWREDLAPVHEDGVTLRQRRAVASVTYAGSPHSGCVAHRVSTYCIQSVDVSWSAGWMGRLWGKRVVAEESKRGRRNGLGEEAPPKILDSQCNQPCQSPGTNSLCASRIESRVAYCALSLLLSCYCAGLLEHPVVILLLLLLLLLLVAAARSLMGES